MECENDLGFCWSQGEEDDFDFSKDTSWVYGAGVAKGERFERLNSLCQRSFVLPKIYSGGLALELNLLPDQIATFMRITDQRGGIHFFNNENLAKMEIGDSKTMMMLEASQIDLVYVATTNSGNILALKDYNLVFKRLTLM